MTAALKFTLPSLPKGWSEEEPVKFHKPISKCTCKAIEPAGQAFSARVKRHRQKRTLEEDYELSQALLEAEGDANEEEEDEPESKALLRSDPSKWKTQDHYAILGLSRKRYLANDDDIKRAYRRKVLKHHPDKIAAVGGSDNFFKCIQKAWEILTDPKKRRQFDSCDPTFDDSIPAAKFSDEFYTIYGEKFASEGRFSKTPGVPPFGDADAAREEVETFYSFWFAFDSWRTFEMRDEEDTDKADSRDEKRWLDRKNFAARKKHKKEDIQRLNKLVEQTFALDPRIKAFKEADKYAKNAKRREREAAEKAAADLAAQKAEEERLIKEKAEADEKERLSLAKKDKDAAKNAIKKEKKTIRRLFRDKGNFLPEGASADDVLIQTGKLEKVLSSSDGDYLQALRIKFEGLLNTDVNTLSNALEQEYSK